MKIIYFQYLFHKSIFSKILISYLLLIIIPVAMIGAFSFKTSEQILNKQISLSNYDKLNQIEKNIDFLLDQVIAVVNVCNQNLDLETDLKKVYSDPYLQLKNAQKVQIKMQNYFYALGAIKYQMILVGKNSEIYNISDDNNQTTFDKITQFSWYPRMLQNPEQILWLTTGPSFFKGDHDNYFTAIKPLQNGFSNDFYGILFLSIPESTLYEIYQESLNNGNQIMIIDSHGKIISDGERSLVGKFIKQRQLLQIIADPSRNRRVIKLNHQNFICEYKNIAKTDWYIINLIPMAMFSKDITVLRLKIVIISSFCILMAFIAALFLSRKITLPLINLSNRIKKVGHLKTIPAGKPSFNDEIEILSREYDHIIGELEKTIHNLVKEQEEKRKVELQTLQAQINPHFLYNTLNSIKCLVWTGQTPLIEPMINALVNLLEQTISHNNDEFITIGTELNNIRSYIYIQEIRLGFDVQLSCQISDEVSQYKIPKLLLQPIVENAIFHGIEPLHKPGCIYIHTMEDNTTLKIEILDNGVGMEPETINKIFVGKNISSNRFSGIGIKNVDERLKLYFGSPYGLTIESEPGVGTSVVIILPKIK